jgi:hypothetical protein
VLLGKNLVKDKHSSLFSHPVSDEQRSLIRLIPGRPSNREAGSIEIFPERDLKKLEFNNEPEAVFTSLYFLCNLQMGPIS